MADYFRLHEYWWSLGGELKGYGFFQSMSAGNTWPQCVEHVESASCHTLEESVAIQPYNQVSTSTSFQTSSCLSHHWFVWNSKQEGEERLTSDHQTVCHCCHTSQTQPDRVAYVWTLPDVVVTLHDIAICQWRSPSINYYNDIHCKCLKKKRDKINYKLNK